MKIILRRILFVVLAVLVISCDNDDVSGVSDLSGEWSLYRVSGGILDVNFEFQESEVVWNFDPINKQVLIFNALLEGDQKNIYSGLPGGLYSYELKKLESTLILFINGSQIGTLATIEDTLFINTGIAADGYLSEFKKL